MATNPAEVLFVGASVKEGTPINIYDAATGRTMWCHKGTDLQGEQSGQAVVIAGEYVAMTVVGRPVLSLVSMQMKNRAHIRSFPPGPVQCLAVTNDGSICSGAIADKIYTWMVCNGQLTSIIGGHYQAINKLKFTTDGSFLVSAGKDGRILVWNLEDLLQAKAESVGKPPSATRTWAAHSLSVTDLKVGFGGYNARVYSVSLDQSAKIHSLVSGRLLMTLLFDCALSACATDAAETRLFVGTVKGDIYQINLFMQPVARERHVQTSVENVDNPIFSGHKQRITELTVNLDSRLLASGSEDGTVRVWDTNSRQCLRTFQCGGNVTTVLFMPTRRSVTDPDFACTHPIRAFDKHLRSAKAQGQVLLKLKKPVSRIDLNIPRACELDAMLDQLLMEEMIAQTWSSQAEPEPEPEAPPIEAPIEEVEEMDQEFEAPSGKRKKRGRPRKRNQC